MAKVIRYIFCVAYTTFATLLILLFIFFIFALLYCTDIGFNEERNVYLLIPDTEVTDGTISGVLRSQEELQRYLLERVYQYNKLPFNGEFKECMFNFDEYDYIFVEGRSIMHLYKQPWDECSKYDHEHLIPIEPIFGNEKTNKIYIYRIYPKNRYRITCN